MRDVRDLSAGELDQTQYLLERMLDLAEVSAGEACTEARREVLQKGFAFLQAEVLEIFRDTKEEDV